MRNSKLFLLLFVMANFSFGDEIVQSKMIGSKNVLKKKSTELSDQSKNSLNNQLRSKWIANDLTNDQCSDILKQIEEKKIDLALIPEIQSSIDVIKADCGISDDPEIVVKDVIPFTLEGTDLYFEWDQSGKLIIKNGHQSKDNDYSFMYSKKELESSPVVLNENQLKLLSNSQLMKDKDREPSEIEARGFISKWWNSTKENVSKIMNAPETDVYLPFEAYHDRNSYTPDHIKELNEKAYGIGVGKTIVNEKGNTELVFAMAHLDSHNQVEVNVGYGWQKTYNVTSYAKVGIGYAAGLVSREDLYNRVPVPFIFPMASASIGKNLTLNAVYIPSLGGINNGAVTFAFAKYTFEKQK